jgi:two-component system, chemotaxis family, response regulator PixG
MGPIGNHRDSHWLRLGILGQRRHRSIATIYIDDPKVAHMIADDSSTDTPSGFLGIRSRMHFTGRLDVYASGHQWSLYLYMGRLIWASGGPHPVRRWRRYLAQNCPKVSLQNLTLRTMDHCHCEEYEKLAILVKRQQITVEQAGALIRSTVMEVMFDVIQHEETTPIRFRSDPDAVLDTSLLLVNAEQMLLEIQQVWHEWCALGLADHSPNLAPILRRPEQLQQQVSEKVYKTLVAMIDGKRTLRDIAALTNQDLLSLMKNLVPLFRKGLIGLVKVADLASPTVMASQLLRERPSPVPGIEALPATVPLVACIDDSMQDCQTLIRIVRQAGYRCVDIQDSVQALPLLLEQKPSIVFLDLTMPIVNGYEICIQLRRVVMFKDTPIIILIGHEGVIDRMRAKFAGASDFLFKPVDEQRVLTVLQKYLPGQADFLL